MTRRDALAATVALAAAARAAPACAQTDAMKALIAAAQAEGSVTIDGPPVDTARKFLTEDFQRAFGIPVAYISSTNSASGARVRAERAAGKFLLDVLVAGGDTPTLTYLPAGWLDRVEPILIAPDVLDPRKWRDDHLWYEDDAHTILRTLQSVSPELVVNTKFVQPRDVPTWKALLDPKWQGKIIAKDPAVSGAGTSLIAMLYLQFGPDYVRRLYQDQKPLISRDARQAVQFLAQGAYPILMGPEPVDVAEFQRMGYPLEYVFPADAPTTLTGSYGLISLVNKAPHPNAAKLFINWLAGREPQEKFAEARFSASLRTDVKYHGLPSWVFPQRGGRYMDTYDYKFVTSQRDAAMTKARALLGE
ncbi:MAG: extracellular solute-binding protein [Candidatus Lustribacter sp.]|jgi:iron(III) transport system substrate-binding protein